VCRKYTPISWFEQKGTVDILIKVYFKNEKNLENGKMTNYLYNLKEGSEIDVRGPFGKFTYLGDGLSKILIKYKPETFHEYRYKKIGMLGAGTGITPLYQILNAADKNKDICEFTLFFGNSTSKDILLREELENFVKNKNFNFKLVLMLSKHEEDWKGEIGHFNEENIKKYMPEPSDDTLILHCGPRSLCREIYQVVLKKLGHKEINIFEF
jgi:NAD(P)H-flavin reductase